MESPYNRQKINGVVISRRQKDKGDDSDDDDDEYRASAMIAAPPIRKTPRSSKTIEEIKMTIIQLQDEEAMKLASRKSRMFNMLKPQNIKRKYRKRKKKKGKLMTDKELVDVDPTQHPYYQQHKEDKKISLSQVNSQNIDITGLKEVLKDFFAFYDPVTSENEINELIKFTLKNDVSKLNNKLKEKYNACIVLTEDIVNNRRTTTFSNNYRVAQSAKIVRNLKTPGLEDREVKISNKRSTKEAKKHLEIAIVILERSKSSHEIRDNVINFYRVAEPKRLERWEEGKTKDFVGEILAWTFRFGVIALANNLREKYNLIEDKDIPIVNDEVKTPPNSCRNVLSKTPITNTNNIDPNAIEWKDIKYISRCLEKFYVVYNPGRLQRSLEPLINFVLEHGVIEFNEVLSERYNDDLFTFENTEHIKWRGELMQKLFDFFQEIDPEIISNGLTNLIFWTERQEGKVDALNQYLQSKYKKDLNTPSNY